eukprot:TRINITY_DN7442_c0_g1_i1.p1 TRINITY_DN7442_c0_g1~~TRINITY_DN7442_c0_g1_i1.p1  ORF type:complete len:281 (+),score=56.55 TRINITY_DN7442_c0_g1_i1:192-1034(+)
MNDLTDATVMDTINSSHDEELLEIDALKKLVPNCLEPEAVFKDSLHDYDALSDDIAAPCDDLVAAMLALTPAEAEARRDSGIACEDGKDRDFDLPDDSDGDEISRHQGQDVPWSKPNHPFFVSTIFDANTVMMLPTPTPSDSCLCPSPSFGSAEFDAVPMAPPPAPRKRRQRRRISLRQAVLDKQARLYERPCRLALPHVVHAELQALQSQITGLTQPDDVHPRLYDNRVKAPSVCRRQGKSRTARNLMNKYGNMAVLAGSQHPGLSELDDVYDLVKLEL